MDFVEITFHEPCGLTALALTLGYSAEGVLIYPSGEDWYTAYVPKSEADRVRRELRLDT